MFSENSTCPACGHTRLSTLYCEQWWHPTTHQVLHLNGWKPAGQIAGAANAHIHRTCQRCGYQFIQFALDASTDPAASPSPDPGPPTFLEENPLTGERLDQAFVDLSTDLTFRSQLLLWLATANPEAMSDLYDYLYGTFRWFIRQEA